MGRFQQANRSCLYIFPPFCGDSTHPHWHSAMMGACAQFVILVLVLVCEPCLLPVRTQSAWPMRREGGMVLETRKSELDTRAKFHTDLQVCVKADGPLVK